MDGIWDVVGIVGVVMVLVTYIGVQTDRLKTEELRYSVSNLIGSLLILSSLVFADWNLSSALIEISWAVISLYGIYKARRGKGALHAPIH